MIKIWTVASKELRQFFDSLMAYVLLVFYLALSGFFTWFYGSDVFLVGQASMDTFFGVSYWTLFFFIPALTMRLIAEEWKTGNLEILLTKPITDWQLILGKFASTLVLVAIALMLTLPYYFTISSLGNADHSAVWLGYLGLLLMSAAYISIGIFASSLSSNQIVGFLLALLMGIFFHFIFDIIAANIKGISGEILNYLSMGTHYESISRGVIDSKDIIYFLSLITLGLLGTQRMLAKRLN